MTAGRDHCADKPSWLCAACGEPWPCEPATQSLIADTGSGTLLVLYMSIDMIDMARDHPKVPARELHERFIGWIPDAPPALATPAGCPAGSVS
jgi:hypothetical protein